MKYYIRSADDIYINDSELPEFIAAFRISRNVIFEVCYYTLGSDSSPQFSTAAYEFNRPKSDWRLGGQAQEDLLSKGSRAYKFYKKWDAYHLRQLTPELYDEMWADLQPLFYYYAYELKEFDIAERPYPSWKTRISFDKLKQLAMSK